MKDQHNNTPVLDAALSSYFAEPAPVPSPELLKRAEQAALQGLALLKMKRKMQEQPLRARVADSLKMHLRRIAESVGANLETVAKTLNLSSVPESSAEAARAWSQLAKMVGVSVDDILYLLRCAFAQEHATPARGRHDPNKETRAIDVVNIEAQYSTEERALLQAILKAAGDAPDLA